MKKVLLFCLTSLLTNPPVLAQKIVFLHHSTGAGIFNEGEVVSWIA